MERWKSCRLATIPGVSTNTIWAAPSVRIPATRCQVVCARAVTIAQMFRRPARSGASTSRRLEARRAPRARPWSPPAGPAESARCSVSIRKNPAPAPEARLPLPSRGIRNNLRDNPGVVRSGRVDIEILSERPRRTEPTRNSRKEVIQPQVPLRLPCYDFAPVTKLAFGRSLPEGWVTDFGHSRLPWRDGRCVQGPGTYSP